MGMTYLYYNYPLMTYVEKAKLYFRMSLALKPADEFLNLNILVPYMSWWNDLTEEERTFVRGRLQAIRASDPPFEGKLEERWKRTFGSLESMPRIPAAN